MQDELYVFYLINQIGYDMCRLWVQILRHTFQTSADVQEYGCVVEQMKGTEDLKGVCRDVSTNPLVPSLDVWDSGIHMLMDFINTNLRIKRHWKKKKTDLIQEKKGIF